jgi:putative FmdB family regulatory protein
MPIYEYQCNECSERHEIIQRFSEAPVTVCPKCGGGMRKLISSPAIQFKGSGFYKTDYPSASSKRPSSESSKPESKGDSKSESKSESKSDSKSESKSESRSESRSESKSETRSESKPEAKSESKAGD